MKKIILVLIAILAGLFIILTVLGSRGEYAAEKLLYEALKTGSKIAANPDVVPPKLVDYIEAKMKKLLQKFPHTQVAKTANIKLAEFYIEYKKYDLAIAQLDKIIKKYGKNRVMLSMAYFLKGVAYEKQDKWPDALKQYHIARDNYSDTQIGMKVPIYIIDYYTAKGREADAKQACDEAIQFYKRIEKENSKKPLGYMASLFLIQAYIKADNFESAGVAIEETLDKYYSPMTLGQLVPFIESVIVTKLNNREKALEIYKSILNKSKDARLNNALEKRIKQLADKKPG